MLEFLIFAFLWAAANGGIPQKKMLKDWLSDDEYKKFSKDKSNRNS